MFAEDDKRERKREKQCPSPKMIHIYYRCPIEQDESRYCPTTFSCGVIFGFNVIRLTLSRLLSSAMFAYI